MGCFTLGFRHGVHDASSGQLCQQYRESGYAVPSMYNGRVELQNNWLWRPSQRSEGDGNTETFEYGSRYCAFVEATPPLSGCDGLGGDNVSRRCNVDDVEVSSHSGCVTRTIEVYS
jgi:hypothetical protein